MFSPFKVDVVTKLPYRGPCNKIELTPHGIEFLLLLPIQYQVIERRVVAKVSDHQMEAST